MNYTYIYNDFIIDNINNINNIYNIPKSHLEDIKNRTDHNISLNYNLNYTIYNKLNGFINHNTFKNNKNKDEKIKKLYLQDRYVKEIKNFIIEDNLNLINKIFSKNNDNIYFKDNFIYYILKNDNDLFYKYKNKYMSENLNINLSYLLHVK